MPEPLNEAALRRPTFTEGRKVQLADGQEWTFPAPLLQWFPAPGPDGSIQLKQSPKFGAAYQEKINRLLDLINGDGEQAAEAENLLVLMAGELLLRNYALDEAALETLLPYRAEESVVAMWARLWDVVIGLKAPKPSAVG